jgi:hypothetical protein
MNYIYPHCNSFVVGACKGTHYRNAILVAFLNREEKERVAAKQLRIESKDVIAC